MPGYKPESKLQSIISWYRAYDAEGKDLGPVKMDNNNLQRWKKKGYTFKRITSSEATLYRE
jgi:hypothetical protein